MGLLDGQTQQSYYKSGDHGNYQFTSLTDIINQFMVVYVGEDKIIKNANRTDVAFHAQRGLAELSFDTLKSCKSQEIVVPASLQMTLPQDYVNYTKISTVDSAGIKHLLYPTSKTSNPTNILQDSDGDYVLKAVATYPTSGSTIPLDGQYDNIVVGMLVDFPYQFSDWYVWSTEVNSGITSIVLFDGNWISPTYFVPSTVVNNIAAGLGGLAETLAFYRYYISTSQSPYPVPSDIVLQEESAITLEACSWNFGQNRIYAATAADANKIKVGMLVSNQAWSRSGLPEVVDIQGNIIIVSVNNRMHAPSEDVTFISYENISDTWSNYKSGTSSENQDDYQDDTYWPMEGSRYGLDPQHAQVNGSFYIDCVSGKIHFSSNISGKTVILDYISDSLGTDGEMQVHKFAEEAMYKWMSHAILSGKSNIPEYQVNRLKKERFAAIRTAKLRLSNLKLEELTQILRGKSKQIKH